MSSPRVSVRHRRRRLSLEMLLIMGRERLGKGPGRGVDLHTGDCGFAELRGRAAVGRAVGRGTLRSLVETLHMMRIGGVANKSQRARERRDYIPVSGQSEQ
jgi:hypothetical protein